MGDIADYYIEIGQNQGWGIFGPRRKGDQHDVTCSRCGAQHLKWRIEGGTWRLFEDKRGDRNEKLLHQCGEASPDDFEDLT